MIFDKIFKSEIFDNLTNTQRWSGWRMNSRENVIEHSFYVVWFSRLIAEEMKLTIEEKMNIVDYAMFHDFDELFTGDIKHGVKHGHEFSKEINDILKSIIESKTIQTFNRSDRSERLMAFNILNRHSTTIKNVVKIADWLSMAYTLEREISLGNKNIEKVLAYCYVNLHNKIDLYMKYLKKSKYTETAIFLTELRLWAKKRMTLYPNSIKTIEVNTDLRITT